MKRVVVFEYVTAGGDVGGPNERDELMPMGRAMRDALVADLLAVPGVQVSAAVCPQADDLPARARPLLPRKGEATIDFMAREAAAHDLACVVAPETGGLLLQYSRQVSPGRWMGCRPQAIAVAASKRATLQRHVAPEGIAAVPDRQATPRQHRLLRPPCRSRAAPQEITP